MNYTWEELKVGDCFTTHKSSNDHTYQKIDSDLNKPFNCVLLKNGQRCNIYTQNQNFSKVEVAFEIARETNNINV